MVTSFEKADEGKPVVTASGDVVGAVRTVQDGIAYVEPRDGLLAGCGSWLTSSWDDRVFALTDDAVDTIEATEIRLESIDEQPRRSPPLSR